MNAETFRQRLQEGRPLLFDGAMGTFYAARTNRNATETEMAVLTDPETVKEIHREYIQAGAEAIKTDTFSLPAFQAQASSEAEKDQVRQMVASACRVAREAVQEEQSQTAVFADLGPVPDGPGRDAAGIYSELADLFAEQKVNCFLLETLPDLEGIREFAAGLKRKYPDSVLIVSLAAAPDGMTRKGYKGRTLVQEAAKIEEVDAVGFNCLSGPKHLLNLLKDLPVTDKPVSIMPNAGTLNVTSRHASYSGTPEYFAGQMLELALSGASIIGGCCGTSPEYIRKMDAALQTVDSTVFEAEKTASREMNSSDQTMKRKTVPGRVEQNRKAGRKSILVELDPPENDSISFFLEGVASLKQAGADMITIADNPIGRPRADSSILACKIKRELEIDVLPHITCRDRNLNAIKALLLGLSIENVHHVLVVTGDPLPTEMRDEVKTVFSFNSRTLSRYIRTLSEEGICSPFHVFGALDVNARNFDVQLRLAKEKEENGVEGFLTQPVLSDRAVGNLKRARKELKGLIFTGLFPVVSYRNGLFLKNEISGMDIPDGLIEQYRDLDREQAETLAVEITGRMARKTAPFSDGYYLITPFKRTALISRIIQKLKNAAADDSSAEGISEN